MLRTLKRPAVVLVLALLMTACSTPEGGGPPPRGGPPAGTPPGMLVAGGTGYIHVYKLDTDSEWRNPISYSAPWSTVTVIPSTRELLIANTSGSQPVIVEYRDLDTLGHTTELEWPDSTQVSTLHSLAANEDGTYLALSMGILGNDFLEVIEVATGEIVYTGLSPAVDSNFFWTADDQLVVSLDLSYENDPARGGAIVAFPLANLEASTDGNVDGTLLQMFTRAQWGDGVDGLVLSPDGSEMLFERAGDLWLTDLVPGAERRQLTAGPRRARRAAFSPQGTHLAFVSGGPVGLDDTYVMPIPSGQPVLIDYDQGAGNEFLLERQNMVDFMLAWLE